MPWSDPARLKALLVQEMRVLLGTPALWIMLAGLSLLTGYSFIQAVELFSQASRTALAHPQLASAMQPAQGIFVPLFGAYYLVETLLLPFVVIRLAGQERQSGALKLLLQLPLPPLALNLVKLAALLPAALLFLLPAVSAMVIWHGLGGALYPPELATLALAHLLYALAVACIALFATALTANLSAAAMICLGVTLGSWVLDFAASGTGLPASLGRLSLTAPLRQLESGLLSSPDIALFLAWTLFFLLGASALLHPGRPLHLRLVRLTLVAVTVPTLAWAAMQRPLYLDVSENHRHSFAPAEEQALKRLQAPLKITIHMAREDSRAQDLERKVLGKLRRALPRLQVIYATAGEGLFGAPGADNYGLIEYDYLGRHDQSYSTSEHEILPIIHALAGLGAPPASGGSATGHPLVADPEAARWWFYLALPALFLLGGCAFRCRHAIYRR